HGCAAETRRQQSRGFANVPAHDLPIFDWWIERVIAPEQFLHNRRPERCGRPHGKGVAHWSSIEIASPNGDGEFFVEANSPGAAEAAAGSGLCSHALFEGQR